MKKFSRLLLLLFTVLLVRPLMVTAGADSNLYACAVSSDTYFYASPSEDTGLFILPQSYYVKILSKGETYCYAQYLENVSDYRAVYGYCRTDDLLFVDFVPQRPYLYLTFDVTYRVDGYASDFAVDGSLSAVSYSCVYYGDYAVGSSLYCYVLVNGSFGYIPKTQELAYEKNTDYITETIETPGPDGTDETDGDGTDGNTDDNTGLIIVIAVSAGLLLIGVFAVSLRPSRKKEYDYGD